MNKKDAGKIKIEDAVWVRNRETKAIEKGIVIGVSQMTIPVMDSIPGTASESIVFCVMTARNRKYVDHRDLGNYSMYGQLDKIQVMAEIVDEIYPRKHIENEKEKDEDMIPEHFIG